MYSIRQFHNGQRNIVAMSDFHSSLSAGFTKTVESDVSLHLTLNIVYLTFKTGQLYHLTKIYTVIFL